MRFIVQYLWLIPALPLVMETVAGPIAVPGGIWKLIWMGET